jgi:hypothetical protein
VKYHFKKATVDWEYSLHGKALPWNDKALDSFLAPQLNGKVTFG